MITRAQFDYLRRQLEKDEVPSRARCVLRLIDSADGNELPNRRERRYRERKQGHPGRSTARERRKHWHDPSPQEVRVRERNRLARKHQQLAPDEDGEVAGLLGAVAEYVTPHLLNDFHLDGDHRGPFQHWLTAKLGDVLRQPDVEGYLEWRERSRERIAAAMSA